MTKLTQKKVPVPMPFQAWVLLREMSKEHFNRPNAAGMAYKIVIDALREKYPRQNWDQILG